MRSFNIIKSIAYACVALAMSSCNYLDVSDELA